MEGVVRGFGMRRALRLITLAPFFAPYRHVGSGGWIRQNTKEFWAEWFGLVADGVDTVLSSGTDNGPAFSKAIAEAVAADVGTVRVGPGKFFVSTPIQIEGKGDLHFIGDGEGSTALLGDSY